MSRYYVTTPVYYANAGPHIGHAYTTVLADIFARGYEQRGRIPYLATGTDEHGDKIARAAASDNPQDFVNRYSAEFKGLWSRLSIRVDAFVRTTDPYHQKNVRDLLQRIYDRGGIKKGTYKGLYCVKCEQFYINDDLDEGDICPIHREKVESIDEDNYFIPLHEYQDWLINHIKTHDDFIRPEQYRNEVLGLLREPLPDLCISRPKSRVKWGIELPFDSNYTVYVWCDALVNYLSAIKYFDSERDKDLWPVCEHIVGKDIIKPHAIYWPILLKAANIDLYRHLTVHGYWLQEKEQESEKMSKSRGNVINPDDLVQRVGIDAFRFFLTREMTLGSDTTFSHERFLQSYNAELANDCGNLGNRIQAMIHKFFDGRVQAIAGIHEDEDKLLSRSLNLKDQASQALDDAKIHKIPRHALDIIRECNQLLSKRQPWSLVKKERGAAGTCLSVVLLCYARALWVLVPVMPNCTVKMLRSLGLDPYVFPEEIKEGHIVHGLENIFPRVEDGNISDINKVSGSTKMENKVNTSDESSPQLIKPIDLKSFDAIDIRIGKIKSVSPHPNADRLLVLEVCLGEEKPRTICAGFAAYYPAPFTPLIGLDVVVLANLKPIKLRGIMSEGMILAADGLDGMPVLLSPKETVSLGSRVH